MTDATAGAEEARAGHKQAAAERAVDWIESGMVVGLGSGSTAVFAIRRIGMLLGVGTLRDLLGVPTSRASEAEAPWDLGRRRRWRATTCTPPIGGWDPVDHRRPVQGRHRSDAREIEPNVDRDRNNEVT